MRGPFPHGDGIGRGGQPHTARRGIIAAEVANAGDTNGDGYDDVVIGGDQLRNRTGQVYVYLGNGSGGAAGIATTLALTLTAPDQRTMFFGPNVANQPPPDRSLFEKIAQDGLALPASPPTTPTSVCRRSMESSGLNDDPDDD